MTNCRLFASAVLALILGGSAQAQLEPIRVAGDRKSFVAEPSGRAFVPLGFNYDRDAGGTLLEDYWGRDWPRVEADFREMKALGANVVRVHLQFGRFLPTRGHPDPDNLDRLGRMLALAEKVGLYLDLTGLGCYHKADVPKWYDALDEAGRWAAQAEFWEAVAARCVVSPAVFCYDLMNEPVVPGDKQDDGDWLGKGPGLAGKFYVQKITLDPAGRPRAEVARRWLAGLREAIRRHDPKRLITVGLVDWSLDRPGRLFSGITPEIVAEELDFVSVHLYPARGKVDEALETLKGFARGKPVVIEETFPLSCSIDEFDRFVAGSRRDAAGWIGFYWGTTPEELRRSTSIGDAMMLGWLDWFGRETRARAGGP